MYSALFKCVTYAVYREYVWFINLMPSSSPIAHGRLFIYLPSFLTFLLFFVLFLFLFNISEAISRASTMKHFPRENNFILAERAIRRDLLVYPYRTILNYWITWPERTSSTISFCVPLKRFEKFFERFDGERVKYSFSFLPFFSNRERKIPLAIFLNTRKRIEISEIPKNGYLGVLPYARTVR